jgi:HSP20 family molecular chaperone IbpA
VKGNAMGSENLNPPTSVLPFEMFRTFSPIANGHWVLSARGCEITETEDKCVVKLDLPAFVDAAKASVEFKDRTLTVTLPKRGTANVIVKCEH